MVGRGGKRSLPSVASARARNVHKEARRAAASGPPTEEDRHAKDEMRAAATRGAAAGSACGGQPRPYVPGAPAETPSSCPIAEMTMALPHDSPGAPLAPVPVAPLAHATPPVNTNGGEVCLPMVQFTAPPPPPLFDPSTFLSGSLAGATRLAPLPAFPGGQQFGAALHYSPPFTGVRGFAASGAGATAGYMPSLAVAQPGSMPLAPSSTGDISALLGVQQAVNTTSHGTPARSGAPAPLSQSMRDTLPRSAVDPPPSPAPSAATRRPVTPPALKRAGGRRSSGISRPRISSVPTGPSTSTTAVASSAPAAASAAVPDATSIIASAATPAVASAAAPLSPSTPVPSVGRASSDAQEAAGARSSAFAARRAAARKAGGKRLGRKQPDSSSDEILSVPAGPTPKKSKKTGEGGGGLSEATMQKLLHFLSQAPGLIDAVDNMTGNVRIMSREMQSQGKKMEDLTVSVKGLQKNPPQFKRRFVDTDGEEYSDHEEMNTMFGNGTAGSAALSTTSAAATAVGKKLTALQEGTLKMLRVRGRVKSRTFGNIGGATYTRDVLLDSEADWKLIVGETKEELSLNEAHANCFLLSDISPPTPRNGSRKASKKGKNKIETRRAYQPITQAISHILEAIKKRTVAAWFFEIKSTPETMRSTEATEWLSNCHIGGVVEQMVKPRFEASELGLKGMLAAVKAMFIHLGVKDRIREPTNVGDTVHIILAWGHLALCAAFVRNALEQIEAGGTRRRTGMDSGWYDRWRWEVLALKAFVPQSKAQWHGMVISDAEDPSLFNFPEDPVPVSGARTLVALAKHLAEDECEDDEEGAPEAGAAAVRAQASAHAATSDGTAATVEDGVTQRATAAAVEIALSAAARAAMAAAAPDMV